MKKLLFCIVALVASGLAQVPVSPAPPLHMQFLGATGIPLSGGKVFTYDAGTTNLANTYLDSSGLIQNTDPIILDSGGFANIWLGNQAYKFCIYNKFSVLQYGCIDNVTGYLGLLNLSNTWTFPQTFTLPLTILATDNQIVIGALGNQTTLDLPPPAGDVTLHFPNINDTMVGKAGISSGTAFNTVCGIVNGPGTYACVANQNPTGTTVNTLTKLVNAPSQAQIAAITDLSGIVGICVGGCGATGNATIQQSGVVNCLFDATATVAGDYVQISSTTAGSCHDGGATYPGGGSIIGRVLASTAGGVTASVDLFGPEICGALCGGNALQGQNNVPADLTITAGTAPNNSAGNNVVLTASNGHATGSHDGGSISLVPGTKVGAGKNGVLSVVHGVNGSGFQHVRQASCVTGAGGGSTCTTTVTWPFNFDDTSYTATCSIDTVTNVPQVLFTGTKATGTIIVTIGNYTAAAASGTLNCIGIHD